MNGFLLIDKDPDWTSSDVVAKLRGILKEKRIGHAGTLDPMATGLLIVMVGKSAKASDVLMHQDKEYLCTLRLGLETDTEDIWGNILSEKDISVTEDELRQLLPSFTGELQQIPPMYSAIKLHGERLYHMARRGATVEREPRRIQVGAMDLLSFDGRDAVLRIRCSSGTYVRTLCHDIGQALGCGGAMASLRREKIGRASVDKAHRISEIADDSFLLPPDSELFDLPEPILRKITEA